MKSAIAIMLLFCVVADGALFLQNFGFGGMIDVELSPIPWETVSTFNPKKYFREGRKFNPSYVQVFKPAGNWVLLTDPLTNPLHGSQAYAWNSGMSVVIALGPLVEGLTEGDIVYFRPRGDSFSGECFGYRSAYFNNPEGSDRCGDTPIAECASYPYIRAPYCFVPRDQILTKVHTSSWSNNPTPQELRIGKFLYSRSRPSSAGPINFP
jgi:hypothetical protein